MQQNQKMTLEAFLVADLEEVRKIAPETAIFAAGGTRRAAALAGVPLPEYAQWTTPRMLDACGRMFHLGVQCLLLPGAGPKIFSEKGFYREQVVQWMCDWLAGAEILNHYREHNWRVRLVVATEEVPEALAEAADKIAAVTKDCTGPLLIHLTTPGYDQLWSWYLHLFREGIASREEAIQRLYGASITPAKLLVSFGKPLISLDILPPLLYDDLQCYWTQQLGYDVEEQTLRTILYDYAYLRQTWQKDKTGRAEQALEYMDVWDSDVIIGMGKQVGPFWFPAALPSSLPVTDE